MYQQPSLGTIEGMYSATITQFLGTILNPIVLTSAAIVTLAFLTGIVARIIELVE